MAEAVAVPLEVSDSELFSGAMETPAIEREEAPQERPRDDHGRFVARQEDTPPEPVIEPVQEQQPEPEKAEIPSWRLREMREERDAARQEIERERQRASRLEQQFQQLQAQLQQNTPKPEPISIFEDTDRALDQRFQPLEQRLASSEQRLILRASKAEAVAEFGKQAVSEMESFIEQQGGNPKLQLLAAQMRQSDHPVGVAMEWYQSEKLVRDTGGDLNKFKESLLDDEAFVAKAIERQRSKLQAQQQPSARPNIQLPPSLNRVAGSSVADADNDASDAGIFNYAVRR
jgi:hypothetical protein